MYTMSVSSIGGTVIAADRRLILDLLRAKRASLHALIGALYRSEREEVLVELLADVETDPDDLTRRRLIATPHEVLGAEV